MNLISSELDALFPSVFGGWEPNPQVKKKKKDEVGRAKEASVGSSLTGNTEEAYISQFLAKLRCPEVSDPRREVDEVLGLWEGEELSQKQLGSQ